MLDFIYHAPTKVVFGKDKEKLVGEIIKGYGYKKIMMQYGKDSIKKSGLYDTVINSLKQNDIEVVEMAGVEPNPKVSFVREAVKVAKKENVELVLAVGGGSVIDSSKMTAIGAKNEVDVWEFSMGRAIPKGALPVAVILTHSAAGSEMSASAVLTNTELNMKKGLTSDYNRPLFSIMNPELTFTVSPYQTACGIVDIMAHTMERYFTPHPQTPLTDRISESILKTVVESGRVLKNNPTNYNARANVMWASSLSHNNLTGCGRENALPVHQLEHALSGEYDSVAHGAGLAVLFPAWAKWIYKHNTERFARFAREVFDINEADDEIASQKGIDAMSDFFAYIGMPTRLSEFGVAKDSLEKLTKLCTFNYTRTVKSYVELGAKEIKEIFELCY